MKLATQTPRLPTLEDLSSLSKMERTVVGMIGRCLSDDQIAASLCRSKGTIRFHIYHARKKLGGIRGRREHLALIAMHYGLCPQLASR